MADRVREVVSQEAAVFGWSVVDFNGSRSPEGENAHRHLNARASAFWNLRLLLESGKIGLPCHDELQEELQATSWKVHSSGKIQIAPKDDIRATLGRSPDYADAVSMAFWGSGKVLSTISFSSVRI